MAFSKPSASSAQDQPPPITFIIVGNPGAGKSTTVNCYAREVLFKASPSANGIGITSQLDIKEHDGIRYMDTPGMADPQLRKQSADAIKTAFSPHGDMPGRYRLVFIVQQEEGRIKNEDLTTLKIVLDALNDTASGQEQVKDNQFAILVNKVPPKLLRQLNLSAWMATLQKSLKMRNLPTTQHVQFGLRIDGLECSTDQLVELPANMRSFLDDCPQILVGEIGHIDDESYEEKQLLQAELTIALERSDQLKQEAEEAADEAQRQMKLQEARAKDEEAKRMQAEDLRRRAEEREAQSIEERQRERAAAEAKHQALLNKLPKCNLCGKRTTAPGFLGVHICSSCV